MEQKGRKLIASALIVSRYEHVDLEQLLRRDAGVPDVGVKLVKHRRKLFEDNTGHCTEMPDSDKRKKYSGW
jgi:hypothetical protein